MSDPGRFDPRRYAEPRPRPFLIRALGPFVRHAVLPHVLRVRAFDLPAADRARLAAAVNPGTAAFVGPNHPEFMTDWMIDKELSRRVSPLMAHWAAYEIVNVSPLAQRFWLANNLIATAPGGDGKSYSVRWACLGHGVLLHPEGSVSWHADHIGALVGGIVDMAWDAAAALAERGERRPVFTVPVVWKLVFETDVARGLSREIAHMERALGLRAGDDEPVERRFAALQVGLLASRAERLGTPLPGLVPTLPPRDYFIAQDAVIAAIEKRLAERYDTPDDEPARTLHRLRRAVRARAATDPEGARADQRLLTELTRLAGFPRAIYDTPTLAQEQISENLKRTRALLMTRGTRETLHNLIPRAVAPRTAHVRVPGPVAVDRVHAETLAAGGDPDTARAALLETHRSRLAGTLAGLVAELAPVTDRFRRPNPLHSGA
ncbi:MAG TPA: hypothetical protein VLV15_05695 [Dongiaceae bacterium]|nr:hypothetical protein [Dongiaceae bacterium]